MSLRVKGLRACTSNMCLFRTARSNPQTRIRALVHTARALWNVQLHAGENQRRASFSISSAAAVSPISEVLQLLNTTLKGNNQEVDTMHKLHERIEQELKEGGQADDMRLVAGILSSLEFMGHRDERKAEELLQPGLEQGNAMAMFYLARMHLVKQEKEEPDPVFGEDAELADNLLNTSHLELNAEKAKKVKKQILLLIKEVRVGKREGAPVKSLKTIRQQEADDTVEWKPDVQKGLDLLTRSAELGNADAQVMLGNLKVSGEFVQLLPSRRSKVVAGNLVEVEPAMSRQETDPKLVFDEGVRLYEQAAAQGHADAWYNLGMLYFDDKHPQCRGEERWNTEQCLRCMQEAADRGDSSALYFLASAKLAGEVGGLKLDSSDGRSLLEEASKQNHPAASYHMAMLMREEGQEAEMKKFLWKAAGMGDAEALFCLGDMHFHGSDGFQVDHPKALRFFHEAARQRHSAAMCCVGVMCYNGFGVKKDVNKAFLAYQRSAELGNIEAMRNLAAMHLSGEGCERNEATARYLLKVVEEAEAEASQPE